MYVVEGQYEFTEKYRPQKIADCILPRKLKAELQDYVDRGEFPSLLFTGTNGRGKTTAAKVLCMEIDSDWIVVNGSNEGRNIDTLRTTITAFASTVSLTGKRKVIIIDEADYLNPLSVQPALRMHMEEWAGNCRFIFTCNFRRQIIPSLHSRMAEHDFKPPADDEENTSLCVEFYRRVEAILANERIEYDSRVVQRLIWKYYPDFRKVLKELQRCAVGGRIDSDRLMDELSQDAFAELLEYLRDKNFTKMRKWVAEHSDIEPVQLFRRLYDSSSEVMSADSQGKLVLAIGQYQFEAAFVADQEINTVCCLTEIMAHCSFEN